MNALPDALRSALTTTIADYTLTFDALEGAVELTMPNGTTERRAFYSRHGLSTIVPLTAPAGVLATLEARLYASILKALALVASLQSAGDASPYLARARNTLGAFAPAARLHQLRASRRAA